MIQSTPPPARHHGSVLTMRSIQPVSLVELYETLAYTCQSAHLGADADIGVSLTYPGGRQFSFRLVCHADGRLSPIIPQPMEKAK